MNDLRKHIAELIGWCYTHYVFFRDISESLDTMFISILREKKDMMIEGKPALRARFVAAVICQRLAELGCEHLKIAYNYVDEIPDVIEFCKNVSGDPELQGRIFATIYLLNMEDDRRQEDV